MAIDIDKGWTIARADSELEEKVALSAVVASTLRRDETVTVPMATPVTAAAVEEFGERLRAKVAASAAWPPVFDEGLWRIHDHNDDPFEGEAPEAWGYLVDSLDRYGFIDRIEQQVDGSWRKRSIRDLLQAAGGDPL